MNKFAELMGRTKQQLETEERSEKIKQLEADCVCVLLAYLQRLRQR